MLTSHVIVSMYTIDNGNLWMEHPCNNDFTDRVHVVSICVTWPVRLDFYQCSKWSGAIVPICQTICQQYVDNCINYSIAKGSVISFMPCSWCFVKNVLYSIVSLIKCAYPIEKLYKLIFFVFSIAIILETKKDLWK